MVHRKGSPVLAPCAHAGTYPPAPSSPGDEKMWRCHGVFNQDLVANLQSYKATISAPHMHTYCLSLLAAHLKPGNVVLDIGSGSGYLTAIFALMVGETGHTDGVEHISELVERSMDAVKLTPAGPLMGTGHLVIHVADGKLGWEACGLYDAIHVGAAAGEIPAALVRQLKPGGRMVIPVGTDSQELIKLLDGTVQRKNKLRVRYVPLI